MLITLGVTVAQAQSEATFNNSFHGDYNPATNDYSTNMATDTMSNIVVYTNSETKKIIVTSANDTLINQHVLSVEQDEDVLIFNTTNYLSYEAVFMFNESLGVTMLYDWFEGTEEVAMHYKHKYFWSNK